MINPCWVQCLSIGLKEGVAIYVHTGRNFSSGRKVTRVLSRKGVCVSNSGKGPLTVWVLHENGRPGHHFLLTKESLEAVKARGAFSDLLTHLFAGETMTF